MTAAAGIDPPSADEQFRAYVVERGPALMRTAYVLTGNQHDAEDLLQTTLAKTYLAWDRIRQPEAVDAYVRRVLVNTQRSAWRRRRVSEVLTDRIPEPREQASTDGRVELHDALWAALARLPRRQRTVLVLRYYEDLSEAETAQALGVSVGTVKSTASRALRRLREASAADLAARRTATTWAARPEGLSA
jgi:RNA polymerase sigma-70 factor (sigma-E family)